MDKNNPFSVTQIKKPFFRSLFKRATKLDRLERWYDEWAMQQESIPGDTDEFINYTLEKLGVNVEIINVARLNNVESTGSLLIVANHPLGGIEGVMLTQLLRRIRPDLKVLTNELLSTIPEFSDVFIGVDVINPGRAQHNAKGMREIAGHLSKGGALLVFPAGTVSQMELPSFKVTDAPWNEMIARLAKKYQATVLPIYVDAKNTKLFYSSAFIHKRLRTLLLPRAMLSKAGETIELHVGESISAVEIKRLNNPSIMTDYIRLCCEMLACLDSKTTMKKEVVTMKEIKADLSPAKISQYLATLQSFKTYQQNNFELYCVPYDKLGPVMEQLSIEREHTFREVDEGSGNELDSDQYDPHYMHLFIWDNKAEKIAGGYRLGKTDKIVERLSLNGLYSQSLFDYDEAFLKNMGKTIEVGRSFIVKDYQKNPVALDLLWKGIGHYVAANPEYHTLFGCVSISKQYSKLARAMLTETFLSHYGVAASIASKVKPRAPLKNIEKPWTTQQLTQLCELPIINKLVGRIDPGKSVPVLIRHYLALNGRFVSFSINNGFNQSLDGLILVDLRNAPGRYLKRYMSVEGMDAFLKQHQHEEEVYIACS